MLLNSLKKDRQGMDSQIANDVDESKRLAKIIKKLQDKMKEIRD
jgi:sialic acid synthase SpsE